MSRRLLGEKWWFSRSGGRFTQCSCSLSQFWFHCGCFLYMCFSRVKGSDRAEPSRAKRIRSRFLPSSEHRSTSIEKTPLPPKKKQIKCAERNTGTPFYTQACLYIYVLYIKKNKTKTPSRRPHLGYIHWFLLPPPPPPSPVARHRRRRERCLREEKCPPMFTTSSNIEKTLEVRWAVWHFDR